MAQKAIEGANLESVPAIAQTVTTIASRLNHYFEQLAPWELAKLPNGRARLESGMYATLDSLRMLFELAFPIIPRTSLRALVNMGAGSVPSEPRAHRFVPGGLPHESLLGEDANLFPRVEA
jgi:methionyl-tRNA synthetase